MMLSILWLLQISCCHAQESDRAKAVQKLGRQLKQKSRSFADLEKAIQKFQESYILFSQSGSKKEAAVTLHEIASVYEDMADHNKAMEYYEKSLAIRVELGDLRGQGYRLNAIGLANNARSQYQDAIDFYTLAPPVTDGFLKMSEVMSLKMDADLVALTACRTGLGNDLSVEGV